MSLLKDGLSPDASDALRKIGVTADRIIQTIGHAAASAGTHAEDGVIDGHPYTAAVDLRSRDLSTPQIAQLLDRLGRAGFAAWWRHPGHDHWPTEDAPHIHAVYAGVHMKAALRDQVHDYVHGRNGLASHAPYAFHHPCPQAIETVRALFLAHNRAEG